MFIVDKYFRISKWLCNNMNRHGYNNLQFKWNIYDSVEFIMIKFDSGFLIINFYIIQEIIFILNYFL